jgi:coproporphyrinogen III oxidase
MEVEKLSISNWLKKLQDEICNSLEVSDGKGKFQEDIWTRPEGGGGRTRILKNGHVIEKGGVLYSAVHGNAPDFLTREGFHALQANETEPLNTPQFYATGISIVIHPLNPMVPIIHMNIRYFELTSGDRILNRWFGGGIDLTPHYIVEEDAKFFHGELKKICDRHEKNYYKKFKEWADDYFYIPHRKESRGIGGIFFDRLNEGEGMTIEKNMTFWKDVGKGFAPIYTALLEKNKSKTYTEKNKEWQLLRRGRYVEFNLIYDKGTKFGLETNGRVESILMSLPRYAGWEYNFIPEDSSEEARTLRLLSKKTNWI